MGDMDKLELQLLSRLKLLTNRFPCLITAMMPLLNNIYYHLQWHALRVLIIWFHFIVWGKINIDVTDGVFLYAIQRKDNYK